MKIEANRLIQLGSLPTKNGFLNKQGYYVYSIHGVSNTITRDTGGPGHSTGGAIHCER